MGSKEKVIDSRTRIIILFFSIYSIMLTLNLLFDDRSIRHAILSAAIYSTTTSIAVELWARRMLDRKAEKRVK